MHIHVCSGTTAKRPVVNPICVHTHAFVFVNMFMYVCYVYSSTNMYTDAVSPVSVYACVREYIYIYIHIYVYIYTYTYI